MAVLRAGNMYNEYKSTHAFLAKRANGSVYDLHDASNFQEQTRRAFRFSGYGTDFPSGLGLAVLYPYKELQPRNVLAAAIEHFAPSIIGGELIVNVNSCALDANTIDEVALETSESLRDAAIRSDVQHFVSIVRHAQLNDNPIDVAVPDTKKNSLESLREKPDVKQLQQEVAVGGSAVFKLSMPLSRRGISKSVSLRGFVGRRPNSQYPIDRLFRNGMSLPNVKTKLTTDLDLLLLVGSGDLAEYLNSCEGMAHLDLLESKEVSIKLHELGFDGPEVKRFIKNLPTTLRYLFTPDAETPDAHVFDSFFSKPMEKLGRKSGSKNTTKRPINLPPPKPPVCSVKQLPDGLEVLPNDNFNDWPTDISIQLVYADGTSCPTWTKLDFSLTELNIEAQDCSLELRDNRIRANGCGPTTRISIRGFDQNRELDANIRKISNA